MNEHNFAFRWKDTNIQELRSVSLVDGMIYSKWFRVAFMLTSLALTYVVFHGITYFTQDAPDVPMIMLDGYVIGVFTLVLFNYAIDATVGRKVKRDAFLTDRTTGDVSCSASADGIRVDTDTYNHVYKWPAFSNVVLKKDAGYLRLTKGHFFVVPKCGFDTAAEFDASWAQIITWYGAAND